MDNHCQRELGIENTQARVRWSFTREHVGHNKPPEQMEEESVTLAALTLECDCVLDFCLEQDFYDSGYCKTNEVLSVLIDGVSGWLGHKRIDAPFSVKSSVRACAMGCTCKYIYDSSNYNHDTV